MKTIHSLAVGLTFGALSLSSCTPSQQQYALGGGAVGAAVGAIAGNDDRDIVKGLAVGALGGAGYATYKDHQNTQNGTYNTGGDTPAPAVTKAPSYPSATRSDLPGVVVSPYKPYNKVRVTGFKAGQLAKDPTTGSIFVVPQ